MTDACPSPDTLSALADGALTAAQADAARHHVARCPRCAMQLAELRRLSEAFDALPPTPLGFDLGARLEARLPPRRQPAAPRPWWRGWPSLLPLAGATAALVLGLRLGASLVGADAAPAAVAPVVLSMSVFDAVPPGNLCPRPHACLSARVP